MFLSSVLENELVDLKVLVFANIPNYDYEKEPLIAVRRDNLRHNLICKKCLVIDSSMGGRMYNKGQVWKSQVWSDKVGQTPPIFRTMRQFIFATN